MAKAKSSTKAKATKAKASVKKEAPKKASGKLAKAAAGVVKVLVPKKTTAPPSPVAVKPVAPAKPAATTPSAKPTATPAASSAHMTWSESLRKAMQDKGAQKHWPEQKHDWKDRQRAGLTLTQRNKFG